MSSIFCTDISILQKDIITGLESVKELLDQAIQRIYTKDGKQDQHFTQQLEHIKGEIDKVKLLIDLVNGIQVNKELVQFRANQGFLSKLLDTVLGNSGTRQNLIDANFTAISESLKEYIYKILHDLTISNTAITITQKKLIETRDTLRSHQKEIDRLNELYSELNSRLNAYEQRVKNLE
jgi:hypothetical protein